MRRLMEDKLLVKEIAFACGFRDFNYFCRAFRRHFGVSPGQVKKSGMY
ncbi:MAG: helix-turn-helix domain-containing protein [Lentisphaerae bacterium]|nr:helix-turn-helix domain-containing protein [Lentisphaerota bacterium]